MFIDEHVLAAFLADELTDAERREVTAELIRDPGLLEWLAISSLALSAARGEQEEGLNMRILSTSEPVFSRRLNSDRDAVPSDRGVRRAV